MIRLEKLLELRALSSSKFMTINKPLAPPGAKGTFGGILVAQSLLASLYTVPKDFIPSSLHCYFIIGGDPKSNIFYNVESLREGRNFIHKLVKAYQYDKLIFTSTILFSRDRIISSNSLHHFNKFCNLPPKSNFTPASTLFKEKVLNKPSNSEPISKNMETEKFLDKINKQFEEGPIEYRFPPDMFHSDKEASALHYYLNIREPITPISHLSQDSMIISPKSDPRYNYVAFSYLSDSYVLLSLPYFHKLPLYSHKTSISLDHSIFFHQLPRVNESLFTEIRNPRSYMDKHLIIANYYNPESTEIVATVTQEGLVAFALPHEIRSKL